MKALTYIGKGRFEMTEKAKPVVVEATDAVVRVTLSRGAEGFLSWPLREVCGGGSRKEG